MAPHPRHFDERSTPGPATDARNALRTVPILADIDDEQLDRLTSSVERQHIRAHTWLFGLGDPSDAIYVIDSGRFAAVAPTDK